MDIIRKIEPKLLQYASQLRAVAVMGVRQSGKTTLCKQLFPEKDYVNFEDLNVLQRAISDPIAFLNAYQNNGAIFDEIQKAPILFNYLQPILDQQKEKGKFILTGSSNFLLNENISQSLAGRVGFIEMHPFSYNEIPDYSNKSCWEIIYKGCYPEVWAENVNPQIFYPNYIQGVLEKDIRQLINLKDLHLFQQFIKLLASRVGQELNYSKLAMEIGIDSKTCNAWVTYLQVAGFVYLLPPYFLNFGKRIIKRSKLYFIDTGIICNLLGIFNELQLESYPLKGEIFENYVVSNFLKINSFQLTKSNLYYWRSQDGVEIDLIMEKNNELIPIEIKSGKTFHESWWKNSFLFEKYSKKVLNPLIIYNGVSFEYSDGKKLVNVNDLNNLFE
jgi:uncharacterized protein